MAKLWAHVTDPPPMPSADRPELVPDFDDVVERAMAKDPAQRYQRAGQIAQDLRGLATAGAAAQFAPEPEPSADPATHSSIPKLLADLEAFARREGPALEAANELSLQLRKAFHYLEELVRQVIQADPPFGVKLDVIYIGALPSARLSAGRVECVMKALGDAEVVDTVKFTYHMSSPRKTRIALRSEEARVLKGQLERAGLDFDSRAVGDKFEAVLIEVDLAASATLRADYEHRSVDIFCQNVGVLGPARYSIPAAEFDEAVWEFGQLLFGLPSRFAGLRLPVDAE